MTARCPAGHDSTELDYCSLCGVSMSAAPRAPAGGVGSLALCPACSEPRADPDARFCEVCRYDFVAAQQGPAPRVAAPVVAAPAPSAVAPVGAASSPLVVVVDPDPATPCPRSPAIQVPFDRAELLIGRKDEVRDVHPEIPLGDPGTSRRHAKLVRALDGTLAFVDLASTNGSKLNGLEVKPGSRSPLHVGDEITLGRWTRIKVTVRG
jgi:hypothetical protein